MTISTPVESSNDNIVGQIQDAFNQQAEQLFERKELKLNTKYYLNNITLRPNTILLTVLVLFPLKDQ